MRSMRIGRAAVVLDVGIKIHVSTSPVLRNYGAMSIYSEGYTRTHPPD